jgi:hypothetical protein
VLAAAPYSIFKRIRSSKKTLVPKMTTENSEMRKCPKCLSPLLSPATKTAPRYQFQCWSWIDVKNNYFNQTEECRINRHGAVVRLTLELVDNITSVQDWKGTAVGNTLEKLEELSL